MPPDRTPFIVHCAKCQHTWTACYLPMEVGKVARLIRRLCCPFCGTTAKDVRMGEAPA